MTRGAGTSAIQRAWSALPRAPRILRPLPVGHQVPRLRPATRGRGERLAFYASPATLPLGWGGPSGARLCCALGAVLEERPLHEGDRLAERAGRYVRYPRGRREREGALRPGLGLDPGRDRRRRLPVPVDREVLDDLPRVPGRRHRGVATDESPCAVGAGEAPPRVSPAPLD